jgi:hypothetical protein
VIEPVEITPRVIELVEITPLGGLDRLNHPTPKHFDRLRI